MYKFSNNIRIRRCADFAFLINISTNQIFKIKYKTLLYLQNNLNASFHSNEASKKMFQYLIGNKILEVVEK